MSARYISPAARQYADDKIGRLLDLAETSGKSQIRFTTDIGPHPALTVIRPIAVKGKITQFIFIQAAMGSDYLQQISAPLNLSYNFV